MTVYIKIPEDRDRIEVCRECYPDELCKTECNIVVLEWNGELRKMYQELKRLPTWKTFKQFKEHLKKTIKAAAWYKKFREKIDIKKLAQEIEEVEKSVKESYRRMRKKHEEAKACRFFEVSSDFAHTLLQSRRFKRSIVKSGKIVADYNVIYYDVTRYNVALITANDSHFYILRLTCNDEDRILKTIAEAINEMSRYGERSASEIVAKILEAMDKSELAELVKASGVLLG
jgi:hypothetical protein